ncbi:TPA: hypothetical protein DEF17_08135, partial [bacterium]|nr:hypothetical protein [bacterium]
MSNETIAKTILNSNPVDEDRSATDDCQSLVAELLTAQSCQKKQKWQTGQEIPRSPTIYRAFP